VGEFLWEMHDAFTALTSEIVSSLKKYSIKAIPEGFLEDMGMGP